MHKLFDPAIPFLDLYPRKTLMFLKKRLSTKIFLEYCSKNLMSRYCVLGIRYMAMYFFLKQSLVLIRSGREKTNEQK